MKRKEKNMYRHAFDKSPRCQFRTPSGRRCRRPASSGEVPGEGSFAGKQVPDSDFCANHATVAENHRDAADLSATLTAGLDQFKSPAAINDFLSRLLLLLAQDRISPRRAAVLAYITNQLLRTVTAMDQQTVEAIWGIPRANRDAAPDAAAVATAHQ
jgi:hypothetical protein